MILGWSYILWVFGVMGHELLSGVGGGGLMLLDLEVKKMVSLLIFIICLLLMI
jgi:hypothetical protein